MCFSRKTNSDNLNISFEALSVYSIPYTSEQMAMTMENDVLIDLGHSSLGTHLAVNILNHLSLLGSSLVGS